MKNYFERIDELRKKQNMTLAQLAKKSGVSAITLTNWKSGKTEPQPSKLGRVAMALNTTIEYLTGSC